MSVDPLEEAARAFDAGEYDKATAAARLSLAVSAARIAQTAEDLVDAFPRYLVLNGHDGPSRLNGSARGRDRRPTDREA
jgi:hypothetical protein